MIRQAISCDICAAEKRQTNHWFVAYEQGGELRVSGWTSRHRLKPDAKHLCGQTCLHKLIDEFIAKSIAARARRSNEATESQAETSIATDTSLIHSAAVEIESSARLVSAPKPAPPRAPTPIPKASPAPPAPATEYPHPELVTMPPRPYPKDVPPLPPDTLRYASRRWHAEAWERERERELRAAENCTDISSRRRNSA
ncbi:MAG: hypothetical protein ACLQMG_18925 [Terracidiphilus sp.]